MHDDADPALFRVAHSLLQAELIQQRRLVIRDRDGDDHRRAAGVLPHRGLRLLRPELAQVHACDNDGRGNVHHVPCRRALYGDAHHYALRGADAHSV